MRTFLLLTLAVQVSATKRFSVAVCGGFTENGLPGDCCWPEALGMEIAKLAWDRRAFSNSTTVGVLEAPPGGVQDFKVDMTIEDLAGNAGNGVLCAMKHWKGRGGLVVAGGWSSLSIPVGTVGKAVQGVQLDWAGTSPRLSDNTIYPYYSRIAPSDAINAEILADLLAIAWGYKRFMVAYERGDYGQPLFQALVARVPAHVIIENVVLPEKPVEKDKPQMRKLLSMLASKLMPIGILFAVEAVTFQVFTEDRSSARFLGPRYLWLGVPDLFSQGAKSVNASQFLRFKGCMTVGVSARGRAEQIAAFKNFVKTLSAADLHTSIMRGVVPCNSSKVINGGEVKTGPGPGCWWGGNKVFQDPSDIVDDYTMWAFDAIALVHYTLNRLLLESAADAKGEKLRRFLRNTTFSGLTGEVSLSDIGDRLPSRTVISSLLPSAVVKTVGEYDMTKKLVVWTEAPIYSDGSLTRPSDAFEPCTPGMVMNITSIECIPCPAGKFKVGTNRDTECILCPAGTFAMHSASAHCVECKPGNFSNTAGNSLCSMCDPGRFTMEARKTHCNQCAPGNFQSVSGRSECQRCEAGRYISTSGGHNCTTCPGIRTTQLIYASTSQSHCLCDRDYYSVSPQSPCLACPTGMKCLIGSDLTNFASKIANQSKRRLTVASDIPLNYPTLVPRHYSTVADPVKVFRCLTDLACPGGDPGTCGSDMEGLACGKCLDKYYRASDDSCVECSDAYKSSVLFPIIPILAAPPFVILLYAKGRDPVEKWGSPENMMQSLLFLVLIYVQMLATISTCYLLKPTLFQSSSEWTRYSFELLTLLRPDCSTFSNFQTNFIGKLLLPVYALVMFAGTFWGSKLVFLCSRTLQPMDGDVVFSGYMGVFNTFFIGIAQQTFSLFQCYDHPGGERSLRSQPDVLCDSQVWNEMVAAALIAIFVFCGGALAIFTYIICIAHKHFSNERFRKRWKFLFIRFRPSVQWWALTLLAKGIWLNLTTVLFDRGTRQLVWLMTGVLVYMVSSLIYLPWRSELCGYLDSGMHSVLMLLFGFLPYFAFPEETNTDDENYAWSYFLISLIPFGGAVVVLLLLIKRRLYPEELEKIRPFAETLGLDFAQLPDPETMTHVINSLVAKDHKVIREAQQIIAAEMLGNLTYGHRLTARPQTNEGFVLKNSPDVLSIPVDSGKPLETGNVLQAIPETDADKGKHDEKPSMPLQGSMSKAGVKDSLPGDELDELIFPQENMAQVQLAHGMLVALSPRAVPKGLLTTPRTPPG